MSNKSPIKSVDVEQGYKFTKDTDSQERTSNYLHFDVSFAIKEKKEGKSKLLLNRVSDIVQNGESLAIMGPSGAGKTTLLRVLTLDAFHGVSLGSVTINGRPMTSQIFKQRCGIVNQEDHHWAFLTCFETISYAADLLMSNHTKEQKMERVENTINRLGLESCKDTIVGNMFVQGLSGGQKRRLSVAVAMMKKLDVLFLDEPTSGLDAAAAAGIMEFISEVTKKDQIITIFTVHQPSTNTFNNFDRILLLSGGRTAYCGNVVDIGSYFRSISTPIPSSTNPAEFLLDIVNQDFTSKENVSKILGDWNGRGRNRHETRISNLLHSFEVDRSQQSDDATDIVELHDIYPHTLGNEDASSPMDIYTQTTSALSETMILLKRHALLSIRDPLIYTGRMVLFLVSTVFFSILYIHTRQRTQDQALNRVWFIAWCISVPTNMGVIAVFVGNQELVSIRRELKNGMVNVLPYLVSNTLIQLPVMVLFGLSVLPAAEYGIMNFYGPHFGIMLLVFSLTMYVFECIAQLLAASFENPLIGMLQFVNFWFTSFLYCGQFLPINNIVWPLRVFSYITPFRYAFDLLAYIEFAPVTFRQASLCTYGVDDGCLPGGYKCDDGVELCYGYTGKQILATLHKSFDDFSPDDHFSTYFPILIGIAVICKIGFFITVRNKVRQESKIQLEKEYNKSMSSRFFAIDLDKLDE